MFLFALILGASTILQAAPRTIEIPSVRLSSKEGQGLLVDHSVSKIKKSSQNALGNMKNAQNSNDFRNCWKEGAQALKHEKLIAAWIVLNQIRCALKGVEQEQVKISQLKQSLDHVQRNESWLFWGPQAQELKEVYIQGLIKYLEHQVRLDRQAAWKVVDRVLSFSSSLSGEQKAETYRLAGELAFVEQLLAPAESFFETSLFHNGEKSIHDRLATLRAARGVRPPVARAGAPAVNSTGNPELEASREELELAQRMSTALVSGDLVSVVEDGIKLIKQFPGGTRARWSSERIVDGFLGIAAKDRKQFASLQERYLKSMLQADAGRQADWARKAYQRGFYEASLKLAQSALDGLEGMELSTGILMVAARSSLQLEDFDKARDLFQRIVNQHAGTHESNEALFYLGLINYRFKENAHAAAHFERLLVLPRSADWELSARYWLWRSLQRQKSPKAEEQAKILQEKFAFSYYGLRAQLEAQPPAIGKFKTTSASDRLWLTPSQMQTWKRATTLLRFGWWEEAQAELVDLPEPATAQAKALMAFYWAGALNYLKSTQLIQSAWDEDASFRSWPFLRLAFPNDFRRDIDHALKGTKLTQFIVQGLIKQESAFSPRAVSSAGALGLMQLLPSTAQDMASQRNFQLMQMPDGLFQSETNIQLGTSYLSWLLGRYGGSLPLALAAYNAGPGRVDRWLNSRPSLADVAIRSSSSPDHEMWLDELPWTETRFYVKAVLRNGLLYELLDKGRAAVNEPVWQNLTQPSAESK